MPDPTPTIGELFKAKAVTDEAVNAAVDAVLAGKTSKPFPIAEGCTVDLADALARHPPSIRAVNDPDRPEKFRRTMARTAILLARGTMDGGG